jgi:GNAT superfamily N-acetyltransferase
LLPDPDDAVRVRIRKGLQQYGIHETEDRRVRADTERERQQGDDGDARCLAQHACGVAQVLNDGFQNPDGAHVSAILLHLMKTCKRRTDNVEMVSELLHEAYAPLAAAGMRFVASHQSALVTKQRMNRRETFVAVDGDVIVGTITLNESDSTHRSPFCARPDVADCGQFAVRPAYQRCGIGSQLMDIVEGRAREKGIAELALNTSEHAEGLIAMYIRKGYRFVEYVRWNDVNYRSVVLAKALIQGRNRSGCQHVQCQRP